MAALAAACGSLQQGALAPKGPGAQRQADLFYVSLWTSAAIVALTLGLLGYAMFRRRRDDDEQRFRATRFVVSFGLVLPLVVLLSMMVVTFVSLAGEPQRGTLEVQIVGHQFWWEVFYPEQDFTTANEVHIPVDTPVELVVESDDVLHSFWVPELQGKVDLVPGRTNRLVLEASEPGTYRGFCAEYCGLQHANMLFLVIAEPEEDFEAWAAAQAGPAAVQDTRGEELFEEHACAGCHTIRGTSADGDFAPDLTHFASRQTLGAGILPNQRGQLAGWVVNSQTIKPGNEMPPITTLEPDELEALIDYLEKLE